MQSPFEKSRSAQLQFEKYNRRVFEKKKNSKKLVGSTGKLGSTALRSDNCLDEKQNKTWWTHTHTHTHTDHPHHRISPLTWRRACSPCSDRCSRRWGCWIYYRCPHQYHHIIYIIISKTSLLPWCTALLILLLFLTAMIPTSARPVSENEKCVADIISRFELQANHSDQKYKPTSFDSCVTPQRPWRSPWTPRPSPPAAQSRGCCPGSQARCSRPRRPECCSRPRRRRWSCPRCPASLSALWDEATCCARARTGRCHRSRFLQRAAGFEDNPCCCNPHPPPPGAVAETIVKHKYKKPK